MPTIEKRLHPLLGMLDRDTLASRALHDSLESLDELIPCPSLLLRRRIGHASLIPERRVEEESYSSAVEGRGYEPATADAVVHREVVGVESGLIERIEVVRELLERVGRVLHKSRELAGTDPVGDLRRKVRERDLIDLGLDALVCILCIEPLNSLLHRRSLGGIAGEKDFKDDSAVGTAALSRSTRIEVNPQSWT